jgi:uncharacterized membrane protein YoaK (UPF0700 family)
MTGTTTQIMIDLADLLHGLPPGHAARARIRKMSVAVATFALGCALAALLFYLAGAAALLLAPAVILAGALGEETPVRAKI